MQENTFNSNHTSDGSEVVPGTATSTGIIIKSFIGVLIAFIIAVPRLFEGKYFGSFFFSGGTLGDLFGMIIFTAIIGFIWGMIYRALRVDKGSVVNAIVYFIGCIFSGLFLANALIVAVEYTSYYAGFDQETIALVVPALKLTAVITFIAVIAGIIILPKIKMTDRTIKIARNLSLIVFGLAMGSFIVIILGLFLSLFGFNGLLNLFYSATYGINAFSIMFSVFGVFLAEFLFLGVLVTVKNGINRAPKHQEYFLSMILVSGILRLYIEIFKLVFKLLAARNRNN